jgi:hypothetical protein
MSNRDDIDENRRKVWKLAGLTLLGGGAFAAEEAREYLSGDSGGQTASPKTETPETTASPEPAGYAPGELNQWDSIEKCLSSEQEESVSEVVGRYDSLSRNDLRYSVETDGNIIMHRPAEDGYQPVAETKDNDFMCDINY